MIHEAWGLGPALFLPLLTGHLLGDFVLQPDWMAGGKHRFGVVLVHALLVAAASWLLAGHFGSWWWLVPVLAVTHLAVDLLKAAGDRMVGARPEGSEGPTPGATAGSTPGTVSVSSYGNGRMVLFALDQTAHLLVLVGVAWAAGANAALHATVAGPGLWRQVFGPGYTAFLVLVSGWVVAAPAVGFFLSLFLGRFETELSPEQKAGGLARGGYWIGLAERTLIYIFILLGEPAGIGFLAAAKSVFRIGEVKEARDRNLAEYILIGTLSSFALAMVISLLTQSALSLLAGR